MSTGTIVFVGLGAVAFLALLSWFISWSQRARMTEETIKTTTRAAGLEHTQEIVRRYEATSARKPPKLIETIPEPSGVQRLSTQRRNQAAPEQAREKDTPEEQFGESMKILEGMPQRERDAVFATLYRLGSNRPVTWVGNVQIIRDTDGNVIIRYDEM